jgi:hypothetical protein
VRDDQSETIAGQRFSKAELDYLEQYLPDLRRSLTDQSIARTYMAIGFGLGLTAQVVGFLLRPLGGQDIVGLFIDLLYTLGLALWTGVVVALFVQVLPEAKRRQVAQAVAAFEARQRDRGRPSTQ